MQQIHEIKQEEYYVFSDMLCCQISNYIGNYDVIDNINQIYDKVLLDIYNKIISSDYLRETKYQYEFLTYNKNIADIIKRKFAYYNEIDIEREVKLEYNNRYDDKANINIISKYCIEHYKNQHYKYTSNILENIKTYLYYTNFLLNKKRYFCSITIEFSKKEEIPEIMFNQYVEP